MRVKIFAKINTSEKVLAVINNMCDIKSVVKRLGEKFEGDWIPVDDLDVNDEVLIFDDKMIYKGYRPGIRRYSKAIKNITT